MKRNLARLFFLMATALALVSCSGLPPIGGPCTVNCGGSNAKFTVTLTDTPPPGVTDLSFTVTITGMTLTNSSGTIILLRGASTTQTVEVNHLQTDVTSLGNFALAPDTYSDITLAFATPLVTFLNTSGGTIAGCLTNSVCQLQPAAAGVIKLTTNPFPFVVGAGDKTGVALDFNIANALTSTMGVDFTQAGVLTASKLPVTNPVAPLEDLLGTVSGLNATASTFQFISPAAIYIASVDSSTVFDGFSQTCVANDFSCLQANQLVSVDLLLNNDGTTVAREIAFIAPPITDNWLEGIVFSVDSATQFEVVGTEALPAGFGDIVSVFGNGAPVTVTLAPGPVFKVDAKGLLVPPAAITLFEGSADTNQMVPGQAVLMRVISSTGSGTTFKLVADEVHLRFTRTTATVSGAPSGNFFSVAGLSPLFPASASAQVQTFPGLTTFEGVTDITGLADGNTVSFRALLIPSAAPPFYAAKVRKR